MASITLPREEWLRIKKPQQTKQSSQISLYDFLADAYRTHGRNVTDAKRRGESIRVDDRRDNDYARDFCQIHVTAIADDAFELKMTYTPVNEEVRRLVGSKGGSMDETPFGANTRIRLTPKDGPFLRDLTKAIRRVVKRGARYDRMNKNWVWICPRTAASLNKLAGKLWAFRSAQAMERRDRRSSEAG